MTQPNHPFLAMLVDTPAGQAGGWVSFSARSSILMDQPKNGSWNAEKTFVLSNFSAFTLWVRFKIPLTLRLALKKQLKTAPVSW